MGRCWFALVFFLFLLYSGDVKTKRVGVICKQAIDRLERKVSDRFAGITTSISGITSSIPEIKSKISVLEAGQKTTEETLAATKETLTATEETLAAKERRLDDQDARINRNTHDVTSLKKKDNSLWRMILKLKSSVWEIMEKLMQLMNRVDDLEKDNSTIIKLKNLTETLNTRCLLFAVMDASDKLVDPDGDGPATPGVEVFMGQVLSFDNKILDANNVLPNNRTINIRSSGRWCCELDIESGANNELSVELVQVDNTDRTRTIELESVPGGFTFIDDDDQGSLHTCFMAQEGDTFQYKFAMDSILLRARLVCAIYEYDPFHRE